MTLQGAEHLLARGYHYGNLSAANELLIHDGYVARVDSSGKINMYRKGANVGVAGRNALERAGIKVRRVGNHLEILPPDFSPLRTPGEDYLVAFVLPSPEHRPGGAVTFDPTQKLKPGVPAKGTIDFPEQGGRKLELDVKPIHHQQIPGIIERLRRGKTFEFFRTGREIKETTREQAQRQRGEVLFAPKKHFKISQQQKKRMGGNGIFGRGLKGRFF